MKTGPLAGVKVIEFAGIGPGPMCAMLLADLGATVLRLDKAGPPTAGIERPLKYNLVLRNRQSITVDLKSKQGIEFVKALVQDADAIVEGFRPGTMEKLGLGPDVFSKINPKLVYGRMTGWGQDGPYAKMAGHDMNYIALTGALHAIGRKGQAPTPPLNLVGDYGGGSLYLAFGLVSAILSARTTGVGQVVDAAMVDGAASLMTSFFGLNAGSLFSSERGTNTLDSGAAYYDTYVCADGNYLAVAPIELKFRDVFFQLLGLNADAFDDSPAGNEKMKADIASKLKTRTQAEWAAIFDGTDACVAPVLSMNEAPKHAHNMARKTFIEIDGVVQPAPAPRFSATPTATPTPPAPSNQDVPAALAAWGMDGKEIEQWLAHKEIGQN
ncbi:CoA transferase [Alcaligenaceae bacterium]|nr:CoA transferase [Alcaligenaceae bacterium]